MTLLKTISKSLRSFKSFYPIRPLQSQRNISFGSISRLYNAGKNRYGGHPQRVVMGIIKLIFIYHAFEEYVYSVSSTWGPSMLPTLLISNDWLLIDRGYRRGKGIEVGDLVTFDIPVEPGERAIKRVIGLGGDCVMMGTPGSMDDQMIMVPQGHCWLIGDNMPWSRDSRLYGPIPLALIKGKIIAKVLPWKERRWIENDMKLVQSE